MTDIFRLLIIIVLLTISLSTYFLVMGALFNQRIIKAKNIMTQTPGRAFGLGLVNFFFFGLVAFAMLSMAENAGPFVKGILTIPALLILAFLTALLSIGLTSTVHLLGERLAPETTPLKRNLWSGIILCLACALPFVGWFLLLPGIGFVGIGSAILGHLQKSAPQQ